MHKDLQWWIDLTETFNGITFFVDSEPQPQTIFYQCMLTGEAAHFQQDWFYTNWTLDHPQLQDYHINKLELYTVLLLLSQSVLDKDLCGYCNHTFARSTKATYKSQLRAFLRFCLYFGYTAVPCTPTTVLPYIGIVARTPLPTSILNYQNVICILHLHALQEPLLN